METSSLIFMLLVEGGVSLITIYLFRRMLKGKKD